MKTAASSKSSTRELLTLDFHRAEAERRCLVSNSRYSEMLNYTNHKDKYISPIPGLYARRTYWNELSVTERHLHAARALLYEHPDWIFCDRTAALAYGLPISRFWAQNIDIATSSATHSSRRARIYRHVRPLENVQIREGIPVLPLIQTVFDCVRSFPFDEALALADSAIRLYPNDDVKTKLESAIEKSPNKWGRSKARKVLKYMDGLSESPLESLARAHIIDMGFELPELQVEFSNPLQKGKVFRVDMLFKRPAMSNVAVEIDGRVKYEDMTITHGENIASIMMKERQREALLTTNNLEIMRLHYEDIVTPNRFLDIMQAYQIPKRPYARNHWC